MTVVGMVANRHEKAEEWRKSRQMEYVAPQKQERNHLGMVRVLRRHFETTPDFREALIEPVDDDQDSLLAPLKIDLLYNSPNQESKELAIEVARFFLQDPNFHES